MRAASRLVVLRNLEVGHMRGAPAKQLDLEVAYAAADLQDRSARNPARLNVVDYCPRRGGESSALIERFDVRRAKRPEKTYW